MSGARPVVAVLFNAGFHHVGVHYVEADRVERGAATLQLYQGERLVWQGAKAAVADVLCFEDRQEARDYHRLRGRHLQAAAGPRPGSTARQARAACVERVAIRVGETEP